jgi:hypothetical protein
MKYGNLTVERRRVYTLETTDIDHGMLRENQNGTYIYADCAARKTLLENEVFQWDCVAFGFPNAMNVCESDSPDTFDVEVFWRD